LLPAAGLMNYYTKSANVTGGFVETQKFHRLFFVPGMGHCAGPAMNGVAGVSPPAASSTPLPGATQFFGVLQDWVENSVAPDTIVVTAASNANSRPLCMFPKKVAYAGGDTKLAASYTCQ